MSQKRTYDKKVHCCTMNISGALCLMRVKLQWQANTVTHWIQVKRWCGRQTDRQTDRQTSLSLKDSSHDVGGA